MFYHGDFPRLSDAQKLKDLACDGKLPMVIEVDSYDPQNAGWHATEWVMGLPAMPMLIHEKANTPSDRLISKMVSFDQINKIVKHTGKPKWLEIWINSFIVND